VFLPPPPRIGSLQLSWPLILAPLSGRTDVAFRMGLRKIGGVGLACTDLTNPHGIIRNTLRTQHILATRTGDQPLGIQLYGTEPEIMAEAAGLLEEQLNPQLIDLNMGCPVGKIVRKGAGSALLAEPDRALSIAAAVVKRVSIPVTVKLRLGINSENITAPSLAPMLRDVGIKALVIHGRTAEQHYRGQVDIPGIRRVVEAVPDIPVFANGNVTGVASCKEMLAQTGAAGVAIGRAAIRNPWLFSDLVAEDQGLPPLRPSRTEKIRLMQNHFRLLVEVRGEFLGCRQFRKWSSQYNSLLGLSRPQYQKFIKILTPDDFESLADELLKESLKQKCVK
jgi:tRNA-dihydrouridine synthase B